MRDGVMHRVWSVPSEDLEEDHEPRGGGLPRGKDDFNGTNRPDAKLSFASAATSKYKDVCTFIQPLKKDSAMRQKLNNHSARITEENFVASFPAYVVASSRPGDNDYHVILGDRDNSDVNNKPTCLLNVEVSGLPSTSATEYSILVAVRKAYTNCMQKGLPTGKSLIYSPGLLVTVTGSGFFDVSHGEGSVGPQGYKPLTVWELHPLSALTCP